MIPQKHKEAKKFLYRSGFFITTNVYPDFGDETDYAAIRSHLRLFNTEKLQKKNAYVTGRWHVKLCVISNINQHPL